MCDVEVVVHGALADFLFADSGPLRRRRVAAGTTVKDLLESLGVPHPEIDAVSCDHAFVGFDHQVRDGDRIDAYPPSFPAPGAPRHLIPPLMRPVRFVADVHLGRLARLLRLLGFDTLWANDSADAALAELSAQQHRVLLSRDRGLLKRRAVVFGYFVRATERRAQAVEVVRRFDLSSQVELFGRCLACNGVLAAVRKADVFDELPPRTRVEFDDFRRCGTCGRVYWKGSHFEALEAAAAQIVAAATPP